MIQCKLIPYLSISIFLLYSCNHTTGKQEKNNEVAEHYESRPDQENESNTKDTPFTHLISAIDNLQLPCSFFCGAESYKWASDYNNKAIEKITPPYYGIIGKLPNKGNYEFIIFGKVGDIIYPCIYSYNKNGILIDSLYLHIGDCDGDDELLNSTYSRINKDMSITLSDTTKYIHYITNAEYAIDSIITINKKVIIDEQGKFSVIKNDIKKID